ncbi:MAG: hypothetical protein IPO73_10690 [Gemmatimonadetes bacterium]|nr:hypothetical protein [Gemmatimonadota bacterium]
MSLALAAGLVLLGLLVLAGGGELLVRGATALARHAGVTPAVIGLTVVAMGTSLPELVVSATAALGGQPAIAMGNVIGSNIFNVVGVLGITALITRRAGHRLHREAGVAGHGAGELPRAGGRPRWSGGPERGRLPAGRPRRLHRLHGLRRAAAGGGAGGGAVRRRGGAALRARADGAPGAGRRGGGRGAAAARLRREDPGAGRGGAGALRRPHRARHRADRGGHRHLDARGGGLGGGRAPGPYRRGRGQPARFQHLQHPRHPGRHRRDPAGAGGRRDPSCGPRLDAADRLRAVPGASERHAGQPPRGAPPARDLRRVPGDAAPLTRPRTGFMTARPGFVIFPLASRAGPDRFGTPVT